MMGKSASRSTPRTTIAVQGARVHNLKNVSVEIPRDRLVVVTGLSGSGKSSLAFDTIYAEGQRRYMESLSSYAKRFVAQVAKPDVDFVFGLSPVISIEQKTIASNPRSTVGTMTDIASYLNLLFATIGEPHCPRTGEPTPSRTSSQILEAILSLPEGAEIELRAPVFKVYGEELDFVFTELRKKGCRALIIDGKPVDISEEVELDEVEGPRDGRGRGPLRRSAESTRRRSRPAIAATLLVGDGLMQVHVVKGASKAERERFYRGLCSPTHHFVYGDIGPEYFVFNNPESACRTCGGLGRRQADASRICSFPTRSAASSAAVSCKEAFKYNPDTWDGRMMYSLSEALDFSLDSPWHELPETVRHAILYGIDTEDRRCACRRMRRRGATNGRGKRGRLRRDRAADRAALPPLPAARRSELGHGGVARQGDGRAHVPRLPRRAPARHAAAVHRRAARPIHEVGQLNFDELHAFLGTVKPTGRGADAGRQVLKEIRGRLELLLGIGLDYLNFNRRSGTLSGGESQRIRLSTQIGSGLMGMLYVLDEPSIGLHPKDNVKMIATLESLRDIGNTVIVVEHDEDTIRAADHIVEMGPGAGRARRPRGRAGRRSRTSSRCKASPTGQFLSGKRSIATPQAAAQRATARRSSSAGRARTT